MTTNEKTNLFAFWEYDLFPYVLGAEVDKYENGRVYPKGYGGSSFRPIHLCSVKEGRNIKAAIDKVTEEREKNLKEIRVRAEQVLIKVAPFMKDAI